ncbi:MAG: [Clostridia bacterium]|nr:[FeFe] hydrogenase H-cluster radical SAM maturase HydE [Clostridia bacterium]
MVKNLIDKLHQEKHLSKEEWVTVLDNYTDDDRKYAEQIAREITVSKFGKKIYFRGIIEFSNICKNDCLYCGIRKSNRCVSRYRLSKKEIIDCAEDAHKHGFRTFVLQSGEDGHFSDEVLCDIVKSLKERLPDCAVTLSVGERSRESYKRLYQAGADRYLLRHEAACERLYGEIHPSEMIHSERILCLKNLREIGFQTGCGFMVGVPHQTNEDIADDMVFMQDFKPQMVGLGPFIPHKDTPFGAYPAGSVNLTLMLISLTRIMLPNALMPATTALGTAKGDGRQLGVLAGCNVVMPNLSPESVRKKYMLYDNKIGTEFDAEAGIKMLSGQMEEIGYEVVCTRGDYTEN